MYQMKFVIIYRAKLEKIPKILEMAEDFESVKGVKTESEYVSPNGVFIEIVKASDEKSLLEYVDEVGLRGGINEEIEMYPVTSFEQWLKIQEKKRG